MGSRSSKKSRRGDRPAFYLPPILLCGIALFQIYMAKVHHLSPWKGGGFGMFAVADAPGMRFLHLLALDENGNRILIDTGSYLPSNQRKFLQSRPTRAALETLADILMEESFLPTGNKTRVALARFQTQNPGVDLQVGAMPGSNLEFYRVKKSDDPVSDTTKLRHLSALRLEMWRMKFDPAENRIYCEPLFEPVERGTW